MLPNMQIDKDLYQRIIWAGIIFVYIFLRIQPIGIPLDRDEGVFGLIGRAILEGGLPYQDGIDHKPPLVFYIYAVILSILPATALGIHIFLHLYNLVTLYVVFLFTRRVADINTAYWVAFFYAIFSINPFVQGFTASTEMFMLLPIMLSLWFALNAIEHGRLNNIYLALSGVSGALACWCKQPAVFSVFIAIIIIVYRIWQIQTLKARFQNTIKAVLIWLAGGVTTSLLIVTYFTMNGILEDFLYWSFQHSLLYSSGLSILDRITMAWYGLLRVITNSPLVFVFALCAIFLKHDKLVLTVPILLGFFFLSLFGVSIGFAYPHYYAQIIPPLVLLAGISCNTIIKKIVHAKTKYIMTTTIVAAVILVAILPNTNYHLSSDRENFSRQFFGSNPFPESISIANHLKKNTNPEDNIFIFGSEPQILLLAERASATEFYVIYPLMRSEYPQYMKFQERVIDGIKETRPKYIIRVLLPASLLYDGKAELKISNFLDDYLLTHYQLENILFFSEEKQAWLSYKHEYFQRGGKRSDASIIFNRRISD
jgi:Dolichyl-phosphate-mannose-protein mannosyltransferase